VLIISDRARTQSNNGHLVLPVLMSQYMTVCCELLPLQCIDYGHDVNGLGRVQGSSEFTFLSDIS
jgi:hypothetical protein